MNETKILFKGSWSHRLFAVASALRIAPKTMLYFQAFYISLHPLNVALDEDIFLIAKR